MFYGVRILVGLWTLDSISQTHEGETCSGGNGSTLSALLHVPQDPASTRRTCMSRSFELTVGQF